MLDALIRSDLSSFVGKAFASLEGSTFSPNWHIQCVTWHLEQVLKGKIRRLIICLPPRYLKSLISSVAFPAFALGTTRVRKSYASPITISSRPSIRAISAVSSRRRGIFIVSPKPAISSDKNTETETRLTAGGLRMSTSVSGSLTGFGGNIIICDDPIKSQDVFSETIREFNNNLFRNSILSRLDDKRTGAIIVVMQRLHANDFVGSLLEIGEDWILVNLPAIAECDQRLRIGDAQWYVRKKGDPLHPAREPLSVLHRIRKEMGPDPFAAQYQQDPAPPGGLMIKRDWLRWYSEHFDERPFHHRIFQSWDTAGKAGARNAYSVGSCWRQIRNDFYLIDMIRGRFDYPELKQAAIGFADKHKPGYILIENASTGIALAQELGRTGLPVESVPVTLSKENRMFEQTGKFAAGQVHFPTFEPFMATV